MIHTLPGPTRTSPPLPSHHCQSQEVERRQPSPCHSPPSRDAYHLLARQSKGPRGPAASDPLLLDRLLVRRLPPVPAEASWPFGEGPHTRRRSPSAQAADPQSRRQAPFALRRSGTFVPPRLRSFRQLLDQRHRPAFPDWIYKSQGVGQQAGSGAVSKDVCQAALSVCLSVSLPRALSLQQRVITAIRDRRSVCGGQASDANHKAPELFRLTFWLSAPPSMFLSNRPRQVPRLLSPTFEPGG